MGEESAGFGLPIAFCGELLEAVGGSIPFEPAGCRSYQVVLGIRIAAADRIHATARPLVTLYPDARANWDRWREIAIRGLDGDHPLQRAGRRGELRGVIRRKTNAS